MVLPSSQLTAALDTTDKLDKTQKQRTQQILATLLFCARAVDFCMLKAIGTISTKQATPTHDTMDRITWLLNYAATYPNAIIRFHRSDMILCVESDAAHLNEAKARSAAGGYHCLSNKAPPGQVFPES